MRRALGLEFLLIALSAAALSVVMLNAFYLDGLAAAFTWAGRAAMAAAATVALVAVGSFARGRAAKLGAFFALAAALVVAALALSSGGALYEDAEGNYLYFALVCVVCAGAALAFSRTLTGCYAWAGIVVVACVIVQAFYESGETATSLAAAVAALALIVYKNFNTALAKASLVAAPAHGRNFATSLACVAAPLAAAALLWFAVLAPLGLPTLHITLLTDYRSLPIEQAKGTADEVPELNYELTTQQLTDGDPYTTDDPVASDSASTEVGSAGASSAAAPEEAQQANGTGGGLMSALNSASLDAAIDAISYSTVFPIIIVILLLAAAALAAIIALGLWRRGRHERRAAKLLALPPGAAYQQMYLYLLGQLQRMGFFNQPATTLTRAAALTNYRLATIQEITQVSFERLTCIYAACAYGEHEPSDDELTALAAFYLRFPAAAKAHIGPLKYLIFALRL